MALLCYLCFCSQLYIVVHVELVGFLRLNSNNDGFNDDSLQHNKSKKFLAIQPVRCRVRYSVNLLHRSTLRFTAAVASDFCAIVAMRALITSSNYVDGIPCKPTCN